MINVKQLLEFKNIFADEEAEPIIIDLEVDGQI